MHIAAQPQPLPRRPAGLALTVLVHAALLFAWQAAQRPAPAALETDNSYVQWLRLAAPPPSPAPVHAAVQEVPATQLQPAAARARGGRAAPAPPSTPAVQSGAGVPSVPAAPPTANGIVPPATAGATPAAAAASNGVLQRALHDAGAVDRALRKENNPYIVAPLDSPQIRLRRGIQAAADLAPNKWYEAPKVEELVNNTGDGARRTRVITGNGTYCVTERATNTSIDMIEKHGKLRITDCPAHETPAAAQEWRTARD